MYLAFREWCAKCPEAAASAPLEESYILVDFNFRAVLATSEPVVQTLDSMDAPAFERAIECLAKRNRSVFGELRFRDLAREKQRFARALALEVGTGRYRFSPARKTSAVVGGKRRTLYQSTALDGVVERVLSRWLGGLAETRLSPSLYSYRSGRSPAGALRAFGSFVREHRRTTRVEARGLFVLRRDVVQYGASIPTDPTSALWEVIERQLPASSRQLALGLIKQVVRREILEEDGGRIVLESGTPTGSSLQPVLNNLYLSTMDTALDALGGHYLRFGDDVLFASESLDVARRASTALDEHAQSLGLRWNKEKQAGFFFNGAGRPSPPLEFLGTSYVGVLGYDMSFRGTVSLPRRKLRRFLRGLRERLRRAYSILGRVSPETCASALVRVTTTCLNTRHPLQLPELSLLAPVDDRDQLDHLDHLIRLAIAQFVAGRRGPRAFRAITPRQLIELGLPSLRARWDNK